jgi:hypothetical protein
MMIYVVGYLVGAAVWGWWVICRGARLDGFSKEQIGTAIVVTTILWPLALVVLLYFMAVYGAAVLSGRVTR